MTGSQTRLGMTMGIRESKDMPAPPSPFRILPPFLVPIPIAGPRSPFPVGIQISADI